MGVVNATPDSFSDGGGYDPVSQALRLVEEGADWLDIGGESTRPGADAVDEAEELRRVLPVIEALSARCTTPISIDTRKPAVARAAVQVGAAMWNDISALGAPGAPAAAAELGAAVVLMHMRGEPATMQDDPRYEDVTLEVSAFLLARARLAVDAGVARENLWIDPGIGFGKTLAHNLALISRLDRIVALGFPVLFGASRKGLIGQIDPGARDAGDRLGGSLAFALAARSAGVAMVRVHDVFETVQAFAVAEAIEAARG